MTPAGIEPATFRFVAQHLNYCATAIPLFANKGFYYLDDEIEKNDLVRSCSTYEGGERRIEGLGGET